MGCTYIFKATAGCVSFGSDTSANGVVASGAASVASVALSRLFLPPLAGLTFAWIFNEYPQFVQQDSRRFISQETGSLYIAKVEPSDVGNYTCVVNNTVTREKVLSSPTPLLLRSDGKCRRRASFPMPGFTVRMICYRERLICGCEQLLPTELVFLKAQINHLFSKQTAQSSSEIANVTFSFVTL